MFFFDKKVNLFEVINFCIFVRRVLLSVFNKFKDLFVFDFLFSLVKVIVIVIYFDILIEINIRVVIKVVE